MNFTSTTREKVSTQIVRQIRTAIISGELIPGQALPCEHDLMKQFNVSKHTLREALCALEGMGFISIKRGASGGPIVSEIDFETARGFFSNFLHFQNFTQANLTEIRTLLEPHITYKATECMTDESFEQLQSIHEQCVEAIKTNQKEKLTEMEVEFHVFLAKLVGNPILLIIQDFVNNILAEYKYQFNPGDDFAEEVLKAHERILDCIKAKDPSAAAKAMYDHLIEVEQGLNKLAIK